MKRKVSDEEFIDAWIQAYRENQTMRWIAAKVEMTPTAIGVRGVMLKSVGVQLPRLRTSTKSWTDKLSEDEIATLNDRIRQAVGINPPSFFNCGHPKTRDNISLSRAKRRNTTYKVCRLCSQAAKRRYMERYRAK